MTTAGIINCSPYGMTCTECNELVIAPALSEYLGSREFVIFGPAKIAVTRSK
jgi:hypothetical protein